MIGVCHMVRQRNFVRKNSSQKFVCAPSVIDAVHNLLSGIMSIMRLMRISASHI